MLIVLVIAVAPVLISPQPSRSATLTSFRHRGTCICSGDEAQEAAEQTREEASVGFALTDSVGMETRPDAWKSLEARDKLTLGFLGHGMLVSGANVLGRYDSYELYAVGAASVLGIASALVGAGELASGRVQQDSRPGFAHERSIQTYCTLYLLFTVWLSLRFSPLYPTTQLEAADPLMCVAAIATYVWGFASPVYTARVHWEALTTTEQLRMKGMIVSGAVGSVFILEASALLLRGAAWWEAVMATFPAQSLLEPSVTLFAAYAVEAGMLIHRFARRGVVTFAQAVPFYSVVVLPLLTLLPMGCLFWWKHDEVSFWNFFFL